MARSGRLRRAREGDDDSDSADASGDATGPVTLRVVGSATDGTEGMNASSRQLRSRRERRARAPWLESEGSGADESATTDRQRGRASTGNSTSSVDDWGSDDGGSSNVSRLAAVPFTPGESMSMERILARRVRRLTPKEVGLTDGGDGGSNDGVAGPGVLERHADASRESHLSADRHHLPTVEEFLIKYKGLSYIHCEWVREEFILRQPNGKQRLQRFLLKEQQEVSRRGLATAGAADEDHDEEDEAIAEDWVTVDRILAEHRGPDGAVQYLVKWCSLGYDECTWEHDFDVQDDLKVQEFRERNRKPPDVAFRRPPRPPPSAYQQLPNPDFKNDGELRDYQLEGFNWLVHCWYKRQSSILADEMGLGKTIQTVSLLYHLWRNEGVRGPFLVVAPLSTLGHWKREFETWTDMNVIVFHGNAQAREVILQYEWTYPGCSRKSPFYKWQTLITTYETVLQEGNRLRSIDWAAVVVDEAHRLKNRQSKLADELSSLRSDHRLLLTGTPLQNNALELFALLHFLEPERFSNERLFQESFGDIRDAESVERLKATLRPFLLRRLKEDVERGIPPKEETIISVELTRTQKKWYRAMYEQNFAFLEHSTRRNNVGNLRNIVMELRKCCNHPYLIRGVEEIETQNVAAQGEESLMHHLIQASGKLVLVDKLLPMLKDKGHRVLIFSQMIRVLDFLEDYLQYRRYQYERIDGRVRGNERQQSIDRFQRDSDKFVFLLCTRAGGQGINLTVADTVIIFDSDWNPQNDVQAQARCHRIGQEKDVNVYRLITRGTYEEEMFDRASKKLGLDQAVLQNMGIGDRDNVFSAMGRDDINRLLRRGAYDVFNEDDSAADAFTTDNIENIMARRTKTVKTGAAEAGPSAFSKATFAAEADVDRSWLNDKNFWANLMPQAAAAPDPNIVQEPRRRRQVQRFQPGDSSEDDSDDGESGGDDTETAEDNVGPDGRRLWNKSERHRLQRALLMCGYGDWAKLVQRISRPQRNVPPRTEFEVERAARAWLRLVAEHSAAALVAGDGASPEDQEQLAQIRLAKMREEKRVVDLAFQPWIDEATGEVVDESFTEPIFSEDAYLDHIERIGYNWIERLENLEELKELVRGGELDGDIPEIQASGNQAVPEWWDEAFDRALILGTYRHGFAQYDKMRRDPELHFFGRVAPLPMPEQFEGGAEERQERAAAWQAVDELYWKLAAELGLSEEELYAREMPPMQLLNTRMKKLMRAFLRERRRQQHKRRRTELAEERARQREEYYNARLQQREAAERERVARFEAHAQRWPKTEKHAFARVLSQIGGMVFDTDGQIDWSVYRERCQLTRKYDFTIERYMIEFMALCRQFLVDSDGAESTLGHDLDEPLQVAMAWRNQQMAGRVHEIDRAVAAGEQPLARAYALREALQPPKLTDFAAEEMSEARSLLFFAKRLAERARMLHFIRVHVAPELHKLDVCERMEAMVIPPRHDLMPSWWSAAEAHDVALLHGIVRHGFDAVAIATDPQLPFREVCVQAVLQGRRRDHPDEECRAEHLTAEDIAAAFPKDKGVFLRGRVAASTLLSARTAAAAAALSGAPVLGGGGGSTMVNGVTRVYAAPDGMPVRAASDDAFDAIDGEAINCSMLTLLRQLKKGSEPEAAAMAAAQLPALLPTLNRALICTRTREALARLPPPPRMLPLASALDGSGKVDVEAGATALSPPPPPPAPAMTTASSTALSPAVPPPAAHRRAPPGPSLPKHPRRSQLHKLSRDEHGHIRLPFYIGVVLRIESLGRVDRRDGFHNERAIYPIGFRSVRQYISCRDISRTTEYVCEILDGGGEDGQAPLFRVTCADMPERPFVDKSPSGCWTQVMKAVRDATPVGKQRLHVTVSGPEYFGLSQPVVEELLQELPGADQLKHYKRKEFLPPESQPATPQDSQRSPAESAREHTPADEAMPSAAEEDMEMVADEEEKGGPDDRSRIRIKLLP
ncbi:hypothetical protein CDCA_CDCA10G2948 [Cyanidium caldarium]|uniref:Uncharacterized protein n=1 Tax=Cyanidium caldarium TaxID=2771 RepID=A0AAV9IX91_CYACA|nr:hypothetical protein CDCA_CDCA10G2948 [Cyanidium caldarium]